MKRFFSLAIAALILFSFAGCKGKTATTDPHDHTHNHTHTESNLNTETSPLNQTEPTSAENTENTSQSDNTLTTDPQVVVVSDTLEKGKTDGNIYTSTTLGITFEKPAAWAFAQESDLAYLSGLSTESFDDFAATAQVLPAVYDMYASHKESGSDVIICYENLLLTSGEKLTASEYAEIIKNAIFDTPDVTITDHGKITIGSRTYEKVSIKLPMEDVTLTKTHYLTSVGNHIATIIVSLPENSDISPDDMFR